MHIQQRFKQVVGKTITGVVEVDAGGDEKWLGLRLSDGTLLVVQSDPEGNGGGFAMLYDSKGSNIAGAGCG